MEEYSYYTFYYEKTVLGEPVWCKGGTFSREGRLDIETFQLIPFTFEEWVDEMRTLWSKYPQRITKTDVTQTSVEQDVIIPARVKGIENG